MSRTQIRHEGADNFFRLRYLRFVQKGRLLASCRDIPELLLRDETIREKLSVLRFHLMQLTTRSLDDTWKLIEVLTQLEQRDGIQQEDGDVRRVLANLERMVNELRCLRR